MLKKIIFSFSIVIAFSFLNLFAQNSNWRSKVDKGLLEKAERFENVDFLVVLKEQADIHYAKNLQTKREKGKFVFEKLQKTAIASQKYLLTFLEEENAFFRSFFIVNSIYVKGDLILIEKLASQNEVKEILDNPVAEFERPIENTFIQYREDSIEWGIKMIGADAVWDMGIRGEGVVVGGQDTGYEWEHPALKEKYRGWDGENANHNYNWHDAIHEINTLHSDTIILPENNPCGLDSPFPCDDHNHGTHTMGTMVGETVENHIGIAPEAKWIACRNMERGYGTPVTYLECFQWFLAPTDLNNSNPDPSKSPHVINNSWSCPEFEGCNLANFAILETAVNMLKAAGVVVVVSAGNNGNWGCGSVNAPAAIFENSFSVGATGLNDSIASFSSRGPVLVDGSNRLKPNVSAPGVYVRSCIRNGGYNSYSGTSMAGPHVVGLVALMISANPQLSGQVEEIEEIIEKTCVKKTTDEICGDIDGINIPNNTYGYGRIDALAAVQEALRFIRQPGIVKVSVSPNPSNSFVLFKIESATDVSVEIFNVQGRLIYKEILKSYGFIEKTINLEKFPSGMYFYRVSSIENETVGKIVKI